jgi:RNA polymerase sigma-70 factor (ECF subfamily)
VPAQGISHPAVGARHAEHIADLFNRYHAGLVRSLAARTRSWDDARDLASQAFTELLALERPASVGSFGAYLYGTARNLATNHLIRQAMRLRKDRLAGYESEQVSPSPEPMVAVLQRHALVQRALQRLPANWRMALILRVWDELPYREILARFADDGIEVTERTARRYVAAALEQCRREILAAEDCLEPEIAP